MKRHLVLALVVVFLLLAPAVSATVYHVTLMLNKPAYGTSERIEVYGTLLQGLTPVSGVNVTITIGSTSYSLNTTSDGVFYSRSDYYPTATLVSAPSTAGNYSVTAEYLSTNSSVHIYVSSLAVDSLVLDMDKGSYYAGENISLTATALSSYVPVENVSVNGSIKDSNDATVSGSEFNCTTNSIGICTATLASPSTSGKYTIQTDDGMGYSVFWVNPFDVFVLIKDSTATSDRYSFKRNEDGYVTVIVTYNSTTTSGNYTASGSIVDENGTTIYTMDSASIDQNNSYKTNMPFSINSNFTTGNYRANISVSQAGGETVNKYSAFFEVRDWTLAVEKKSTDSGFEFGYTTFPNTTVFFDAFPRQKSNSNTITGLASDFNITLKNTFGAQVSNATAAYSTACSCYRFNLTMPETAGTYVLSVSVYYNETQTVQKIITVSNATASATTTDISGTSRSIFTSEYIYIKPTLANNTNSSLSPDDAEVVSVIYENGTRFTYTNVSTWDDVNLSNSVNEWSWNDTSKMIKMDAPDLGGVYKVEVYVNSRASSAVTKFFKKLYVVRSSFKNSEDVGLTTDYWWHFKTTDTLYAHLVVVETDVNTITNLTATSGNGSGDMWGMGAAPNLDTTSEKAVVNATITMKVYHSETGKEEILNQTSSVCKTTNADGKYICTLKPNETSWTGGGHRVEFTITSSDGSSKDTGMGWFEARAFYIYGWAQNWRNKPNSTVTLNINAYVAGSDWWSARSGGGIEGTVVLEKIEYMGTGEYWLSAAVEYDYNTTGMNSTSLSTGQGTLDMDASRASGSQWKSGSYVAVVKVTETSSGTVDYGRIWFEVRNWDVYAQPVEVLDGNIQYKWRFNNDENVTLYVVITNAGEWGTAGNDLGGNVTISVKSIKNYITWPPKQVNSSEYSSTNITVNESNSYFWGSAVSESTYGKYVINISPNDGSWDSGQYSMVLDVNGTETGYAWFTAIAFYVDTRSVDENMTDANRVKGKEPLYFNITTTKNQRWGSSYSTTDYVNTTIKEVKLRRWTGMQEVEYKYPGTLNVSVVGKTALTINGTDTLNITLASGANWSSGYYNGEIILEDANGSDGNGWLWVEVKQFRVHFGTAGQWTTPTIGTGDNLTGELTIYEPGWSSWTILVGNYTIDNVTQEDWTMAGPQLTSIENYTPSSSAEFNTSVNISIEPNDGLWGGSWTWKNIKPSIRAVSDNSIDSSYIGFRVLPALVNISRASAYTTSTSANVTITIAVTSPTNASVPSVMNLTSVTEWVWDPSSSRSTLYEYNFSVGSCTSRTVGSGGCLINSTADNGSLTEINVTLEAPDSGWTEGYHSMDAYFSQTNQQTKNSQWDICNWDVGGCNIYFSARESLRGYMYAQQWRSTETDNVTMYIYSLRDLNDNSVTANVTNVQYAKQTGNCWSDSCRVYATASWDVVSANGTTTGNDEISGAGYVKLLTPSGNWERGEYYTKITVQSGSDTARIKDGNFMIVDTSPPNVTIINPIQGQSINATTSGSFTISATTSKNSMCYVNIYSYDSYHSSNCGSNATSNASAEACDDSFNGSTYYYDFITAWCYSGAKCMSTGGTSHSYTYPTTGLEDQEYVVQWWCYDDDWNTATNQSAFTMTNTSGALGVLTVNLSSPTNTSTVNSNNVTFTWQAAGNASNYQFQLSTTSLFTFLLNDSNISANSLTIPTLTNGTTYQWRVRGYNGSDTGNWSGIWRFLIDNTTNNTAPIVQSIVLNTSGDTNYTTQNLHCWATPSDVEGNTTTAYVKWWNTSQYQSQFFTTKTNISNGTPTLVFNLSSGNTTAGQLWTCSVLFDDSADNSSWANASLNVTSTNTAPTVHSISLNTSGSTNMTNQSLECWAAPNDADGNTTTAYVKWWNDSSHVAGLFTSKSSISNGTLTLVSTLGSGNTSGGETWNCSVIFDDGADNSSSWVNTSLVIVNTTAPAWSNLYTNSTLADNDTMFSVQWTDDFGLSGYIFSTNNTGAWVNDTWTAFTTALNWSNATKTLNATVNLILSWMVYANDSDNTWNSTSVNNINTTS